MIVRKVTDKDIPQLLSLLDQLGYTISAREIQKRIDLIESKDDNVIFVAEKNDKQILGCLHVTIDSRLAEGAFGEIVSLVVDERERGKKIGRKLVNAAVSWISDKGNSRVRVRCNVKRHEAHLFYTHLGFDEIKSQKIFEMVIG